MQYTCLQLCSVSLNTHVQADGLHVGIEHVIGLRLVHMNIKPDTARESPLRRTILGSSEGLSGSTAILTTACVWNASGRKMCTSPSRNSGTICRKPGQE